MSEQPMLRVLSGAPSPEELAAVLAVVAALPEAEPDASAPRVRRGGWSDPAAVHRRALLPGPNGWRASTR